MSQPAGPKNSTFRSYFNPHWGVLGRVRVYEWFGWRRRSRLATLWFNQCRKCRVLVNLASHDACACACARVKTMVC